MPTIASLFGKHLMHKPMSP